MKASEIAIGYMVENPRDVSYLVFSNEFIKNQFIEWYGDVEVVYNKKYGYYAVPEFAEGRKKISDIVASECAVWGCE